MEDQHPPTNGNEPVPFGQRLYESPFVLLVIGLLVMFVFFTIWGMWEILSLETAPLP